MEEDKSKSTDNTQPDVANQPAAPEQPGPSADKTTSASQFRDAAKKRQDGELLTLESGNTLRVRRPSVSNLVKTGQLPTELANAAIRVQSGGNTSNDDIKKFAEYQERLVKLSLVSPTVVDGEPDYNKDQISINDLADDEQTEIMIYVNGGLEALAKFRSQRQSLSAGPDLS